MTFTITGTSDCPDGTFQAMLEGVEIHEEGGFDGKGFRVWHFLADVNGTLTPVDGLTSKSTGPKSKAYQWLTAIEKRPLLTGQAIEPVGKSCTVQVSRNKNGYATVTEVTPYASPDQVEPGLPR